MVVPAALTTVVPEAEHTRDLSSCSTRDTTPAGSVLSSLSTCPSKERASLCDEPVDSLADTT